MLYVYLSIKYITLSPCIQMIVYRSLSNNVFANLALEDWLFQNVNFAERRILLLWRNKPCVSHVTL